MPLDKPFMKVLLATVLMLSLATTALADSDSDSDSEAIVGSWEVTSTLPSGEEAPGFFTFESGHTWIATGSQLNFSLGHGAWEQTGSRTFAATNKGFVFGPDGSLSLLIKNQGVLELSSDGNSFTTAFATEVSLPDGTVVDSFSGAGTGTRIQVE